MDKAARWTLWLLPFAIACGNKVEGPFEGLGRYEGRYPQGAPEGWGDRDQGEQGVAGNEGEQGRQDQQTAQGGQQQAGPDQQRGQVPEDLNEALGSLRESIDDFRGSEEAEHTELVNAFRQLADALEMAPGAPAPENRVEEIRSYAQRIEDSKEDSPQHTEWAKAALDQAVSALTAMAREDDRTLPGVATVRDRVRSIDTERPLLPQREGIANVLEDVTGLVEEIGRPERPATGTR